MKTIEIQDNVYDHVLRNTSYIGEDASSILCRLLGLTNSSRGGSALTKNPMSMAIGAASRIDECLSSPRVLAERDAIGRFLAILSWLYQKHLKDFEKILMIEGRKRKYFGRSETELDESGNSVMPQKIPDSPYWVTTNNDTPKKARMLGDVLQVLGYGQDDVGKVERALD